MALSDIGKAWQLARRVERLFELENKHGAAIEEIAARLARLEERVARLEVRDEVVAAQAASAATAAAALAMSDVSRRIGVLEERTRLSDPNRGQLPPPAEEADRSR